MSRARAGAGGDAALLAVIAGLGAVVLLTWAWGGLAGALFGQGWPTVSVGGLLGVVLRLPEHLADPSTAWPGRARAALPGPAAFYGVLAPLLLLAVALARVARRISAAGAGRGHLGGERSAVGILQRARAVARIAAQALARWRWAARARTPRGAGCSTPSAGTRWWPSGRRSRANRQASRSRRCWSGRDRDRLLDQDRSAVGALRRGAALGEALVFDPFRLSGLPSHTWSPLRERDTWDGALEVAWRIAAAGELDQRGVEGGDFWTVAAEQRLAPLLFAARRDGRGIEQVVGWAYGQGARSSRTRSSGPCGSAWRRAAPRRRARLRGDEGV